MTNERVRWSREIPTLRKWTDAASVVGRRSSVVGHASDSGKERKLKWRDGNVPNDVAPNKIQRKIWRYAGIRPITSVTWPIVAYPNGQISAYSKISLWNFSIGSAPVQMLCCVNERLRIIMNKRRVCECVLEIRSLGPVKILYNVLWGE